MAESTKIRYAIVTGGNRGIGFGICEQLAANGVVVVLTARDEKRGLEAVDKLKERGLSGRVLFHQLDVANQASVASLADFVKNQFGKLDILESINGETLREMGFGKEGAKRNWQEVMVENCELDEECLSTNYYGAKRMIEAFIPLLKLSDSPWIFNVSSSMGLLKHVSNHWAKEVLQDADNLTEEKIDEVVSKYLQDFKEGSLQTKGWPTFLSAYIMSKAALNAYARIFPKKYSSVCINVVCPGFVNTDINFNTGVLSVEEGVESAVRLVLLPDRVAASSTGKRRRHFEYADGHCCSTQKTIVVSPQNYDELIS